MLKEKESTGDSANYGINLAIKKFTLEAFAPVVAQRDRPRKIRKDMVVQNIGDEIRDPIILCTYLSPLQFPLQNGWGLFAK